MKRLTISILVLVLMALGLLVSAGTKTSALTSRGPSLTIIFRGLMAFQQDRDTLAVGIVRAPEHEFTVQVLEKSPLGISTYSIPMNVSKSDTWLVEMPAQRSGVTYYQSAVFDRNKGAGDIRDFRWLIDLEGKEFYGRKLATDRRQMEVELRFSSGEFYTKTTTRPLERKLGAKTFEYFGRVAQEIATDVFLEEGDFVLTSQTSGAEIFRLKQKPETTYELVFENAPPPMQHPAMGASHFQFYYGLFPMPKSQWYEFRVVPQGLKFAHPPSTDEIPCMPTCKGCGR